MPQQLSPDKYTVGWICALPIELAAAQEMLDEEHADLPREPGDNDENTYVLGSIGGHNTAIVCLPAGRIGNNPAAAVAMQMRATFKELRFGLMVGIGGGVPGPEADVRLGDVVVSQPNKTLNGVVQYDLGKTTPSGFGRTGALNAPPQTLLSAVARVQAGELRGRSKVLEHLAMLTSIPRFQRSRAGPDVLFEAAYDHARGQTCDACRADRQKVRLPRDSEDEVVVHYGTIASGNQVMKSARQRDKVSEDIGGGVLCFEMEAAGLMNCFPCLVIRDVCDYADSHKNKQWQAYAAGTAAAYAKGLLSVIRATEITETHTVGEAVRETVGLQKEIKRPSGNRAAASPLPIRTNTSLDQYDRNEPQFGCENCDRKFGHKEAANQHGTEKNHWPRFKCRKCAKEFPSDQAANQHRESTNHWPPNISCQMCPKTFSTLHAADQHQHATKHRALKISCKMCSLKFRSEIAANQHMRDRSDLVVYR